MADFSVSAKLKINLIIVVVLITMPASRLPHQLELPNLAWLRTTLGESGTVFTGYSNSLGVHQGKNSGISVETLPGNSGARLSRNDCTPSRASADRPV